MRMPSALSYTSHELYREDTETFYLDRMTGIPGSRRRQGRPAAVGSGFDAQVKSSLYHKLFGNVPPQFDFTTLFEKQVEPEHRDWAREATKHVFDAYVASGAYADLLRVLEQADEPPRFELDVCQVVGGVPLRGIPDLHFKRKSIRIGLDWKVRGYCSSASPSPGYLLCRDGVRAGKQSRSHDKRHKLCEPMLWEGLAVSNLALEETNPAYAKQLCGYDWIMGGQPGSEDFVAWIEELVCDTPAGGGLPNIRVATHRAPIGGQFQRDYLAQLQASWASIASGHVFWYLSREQSDFLVALLDRTAFARAVHNREQTAEMQLARLREVWGLAA